MAAEPTTLATDEAIEPIAPGQPALGELALQQRLVVGASAVADLGLRTALASALAVAVGPFALVPGQLRRDRDAMRFWAELGERRDAGRTFPRPNRRVQVTTRPVGRGPLTPFVPELEGGRVETLRFRSPYVPVTPGIQRSYARNEANGYAWAQHWRHDDGPRPTLCVVHGFTASAYAFNSWFFALPWFFERGGYDVLLYVLPYHGARRRPREWLNGAGLFASGIAHLCEGMRHGVHDFRLFLDYLENIGVPRVGVTGLSLGGYTSALLAAVEDRLHVAIPNAAVTDIPGLVRDWFPAGQLLRGVSAVNGIAMEEVDAALAAIGPLNYDPVVPFERRMIIGGLGDRLAPPEQSHVLWEHWDRCRLHWFPGNHVLHFNRGAYFKEMARFMRDTGFAP